MTAIDRHPPNFPVHYPPIPQPLPEVPAPTGDAVKKAEFEKIADAEVDDGAEVPWQKRDFSRVERVESKSIIYN